MFVEKYVQRQSIIVHLRSRPISNEFEQEQLLMSTMVDTADTNKMTTIE